MYPKGWGGMTKKRTQKNYQTEKPLLYIEKYQNL